MIKNTSSEMEDEISFKLRMNSYNAWHNFVFDDKAIHLTGGPSAMNNDLPYLKDLPLSYLILILKFVISRSKKYNLPYFLDEKKILSYVLSWTTFFLIVYIPIY